MNYLLFDLGRKTDMHTIAAVQRLLQAAGINGIAGNNLEGAVEQLVRLVRIPGHDPYSKPGFFQAARYGLSQQSGSADNHDCLLHDHFLLSMTLFDSSVA